MKRLNFLTLTRALHGTELLVDPEAIEVIAEVDPRPGADLGNAYIRTRSGYAAFVTESRARILEKLEEAENTLEGRR